MKRDFVFAAVALANVTAMTPPFAADPGVGDLKAELATHHRHAASAAGASSDLHGKDPAAPDD